MSTRRRTTRARKYHYGWFYRLKMKIRNSRRVAKFKAGLGQARFIYFLAIFMFASMILGTFTVVGVFAWYSRDLPDPSQVVRRDGFSTKIYDRNNVLLYDVFGDENRVPVEIEDIPDYLKQGTVAIEDKQFFTHGGYDPKGLTRALVVTLFTGRKQGGSTLTQQLVKNVLLTSERKLSRKIKEFVLAVQIESRFNKDEILQMYLNEVPYGGTAWGVGAAAETYFGKSVSELNLVESAILAGMPQRPSAYSPYSSTPTAYIGRTTHVLRRMREDGYITPEQEQESLEALPNVQFAGKGTYIKAPHFVFYVISQLEEMYGEDMVQNGGLRVITSLDTEFHERVQTIVTEEIADVADLGIGNGAALVMNPQTGEILSMVGSKDYYADDYDGQVNVTLSMRQPGSTIKPVTFAAAFARGYNPSSMIMDTKTEFPGGVGQPPYIPVNYDGNYRGPVQLRPALGSSLNVPAVKLLANIGIEEMLGLAYNMGLDSLEPTAENLSRFGLSVTLGGGEVRLIDLVESYSSFANGGIKVEPISVLRIEDRNQKVLFEHRPVQGKRVLDEEVAFLINDVLQDNDARLLTFGSNSLLNMGNRSIAVKTGTTNDRRDNWTIGWSTNAIVGVWVGNNDNTPMKNVASGVTGASPIWRQVMLDLWESNPGDEFTPPSNVESVFVDSVSGYPEHDGFPSKSDYVVKGTLPPLPDPIHVKLKLCNGQDKLATLGQISSGNYYEKEYFIFAESDPFEKDGINAWQKGIDEWLSTQGDERYNPPTDKCEGSEDAIVQLVSPDNERSYDGNDIEFEIKVIAEQRVEKLEIEVNGKVLETLTDRPFKTTIHFETGSYEMRARAYLEGGKKVESGSRKFGTGGAPWNPSESTPTPTPTPIVTPEATSSATP